TERPGRAVRSTDRDVHEHIDRVRNVLVGQLSVADTERAIVHRRERVCPSAGSACNPLFRRHQSVSYTPVGGGVGSAGGTGFGMIPASCKSTSLKREA